ncbi:hypothetical protein E1162_14550 [Rhodobacteraceae bacterium RKSG542]|nr:alpha/beta hydrolase [Pseudovibrio flavus]MTI18461.1 hypothetical protein [Pseudovibrio flavus]
MRAALKVLIVIVLVLTGIYFFGPRASDDTQISFKPSQIGENVDEYLAERESQYDDIRSGLAKQVIWNDPQTKQKTPYSIVYLHGFSASKCEIRPVPDNIADAMGANLFYTRLKGHARTSEAMGEATLPLWLDDLAEALEIGKRIGEKTIVISTSTGSTLASFALLTDQYPELKENLEAVVMVSPNFGPNAFGAFLLAAPYAKEYVPLILGKTYGDDAGASPERKHCWTMVYPSTALVPMAASVDAVSRLNAEKNTVPSLFFVSEKDQTVDPAKTHAFYDQLGGSKEWIDVERSGDPNFHINAGAVVSPMNDKFFTDTILDWLQGQGLFKP